MCVNTSTCHQEVTSRGWMSVMSGRFSSNLIKPNLENLLCPKEFVENVSCASHDQGVKQGGTQGGTSGTICIYRHT